MISKDKILSFVNISKTYFTEMGRQIIALQDISFDVFNGEFFCLLGPSGCGKTTILRLVAGLEQITSGKIIFNHPSANTRQSIGLITQQNSLFPWLNVLDNTAFALELKGMKKKGRYEIAREKLRLVNISDEFFHSYPYELSGGMQQRVSIARALAFDPEILLMDEPFASVDERTRFYLQDELLKIWRKSKKTVLFVTHNIEEALYLSSRLGIMETGKISSIIKNDLSYPRERLSEKFTKNLLDIRSKFEAMLSMDRANNCSFGKG